MRPIITDMPKMLVGRGTILNTATVAVGAGIGLLAGNAVPPEYKDIAQTALGLVTVGLGLKLFLQAKSILLVAAAMVLGGCLGLLLGIQSGIEAFAEWAKQTFGGQGSATFTEAVVSTSILFCVGPMTLLGCLKDALDDDIELIAIKSTMDGLGAIFFAATLGPGVLVTAGVVFIVQGTITLAASPLRKFANDEVMLAEATAVGGTILVAIGLGLLQLKNVPTANYLPALALAPMFVSLTRKFAKKEAEVVFSEEAP